MIVERREHPRKGATSPEQWTFANQDWKPRPDIKMVELCPYWVAAATIFIVCVMAASLAGFLLGR